MPTLFRLLFFGGAIVAGIYAVMLALVLLVDPGQHEMHAPVSPGSLTTANPTPVAEAPR